MPLVNVADKLINEPSFVKKLDLVTIDSVMSQFAQLTSTREVGEELEHDWHHLLLSASVLLQSDREECQVAALRIACRCLQAETSNSGEKVAAVRLLDRMGNYPAIELAIQRGLVRADIAERDSVFSAIERAHNRIQATVALSDGNSLKLNRFQRAFWASIAGTQWLSASAPTSAGKSFVVLQWLGNCIREREFRDAIYLVPTRALISQVEQDIKRYSTIHGMEINVTSVPQDSSLVPDSPNILVFTQERLHFFMNQCGGLPESIGAVVVDEAQKIADRHRGILLQESLERIAAATSVHKVVFLSPMSANPEALLRDAPRYVQTENLSTANVTVNQNLIWATQVPRQPKIWDIKVCVDKGIESVGTVELEHKPDTDTKRLSFVALALSHDNGNLIYVNTAALAEKTAMQLHDCLQDQSHPDIDELVDLVCHAIHPEYQLVHALRRGIGFHYGNMPLIIKSRIEELFSQGVLRFLVCTSTLVEGVNTSCKNIFVRGPKKGQQQLMKEDDFWNLAGRAGRLGREFQGNIICIDTDKPKLWDGGIPPTTRRRYQIVRSADRLLGAPDALIAFVQNGTTRTEANKRPDLEFLFSYLVSAIERYGTLKEAPWAEAFGAPVIERIEECITGACEGSEIPKSIVSRNIGVSPLALQSLLEHFRKRSAKKPIEDLLPADPASGDIVENFSRIFSYVYDHLNEKLGPNGPRGFMLALLVSKWMRGYPLSRLIRDRIENDKKRVERTKETPKPYKGKSQAALIRSTMEDVEQIARFEAPRSLQAYVDVLRFFLKQIDRNDLAAQLVDIGIYLELGVSQTTQVSLISLGLSRTSAIALADYITDDSLTADECLQWLATTPWNDFDFPSLLKKEIAEIASPA